MKNTKKIVIISSGTALLLSLIAYTSLNKTTVGENEIIYSEENHAASNKTATQEEKYTVSKKLVTLEEKYGESEVIMHRERLAREEEIIGKIMIADVSDYVNIRSEASEESDIVGKLYNNSVGTLLEIEKDWYKVLSGSVEGYIKSEYVLTGEEAMLKAEEAGLHLAIVKTTTLRVREEPSENSRVITLVPDEDILEVIEKSDGWVKVATEEGEGYVSLEFVETYTQNVEAESIEEERRRLEKEEAERQEARERARRAQEERAAQEKKAEQKLIEEEKAEQRRIANEKAEQEKRQTQARTVSEKKTEEAVKSESSNVKTGNESLGQQIANYAVGFIGNPYVYGGTSLTDGIDCSGFVMRVYEHFGIKLPRTSGEQGASGSKIASLSDAAAGDLIWYSGHIGIYIGNGQIVHASNAQEGIKISNATYRTILGIRRIV